MDNSISAETGVNYEYVAAGASNPHSRRHAGIATAYHNDVKKHE
jgi:hypothetical protein